MPVSIGIPFYNAERFFPDAIRSVFAQTYQDWELILIDDGSTDRSLEIARSIDDSRVRVLFDGKNRHLPFRLNQFIHEAKHPVVARMDADDIMASKRLELQYKIFDDPNIQIVSTAYCTIDDSNSIKTVRNTNGVQDCSPFGVLRHKECLCHPSIAVRKTWYQQNLYDEEYLIGGEDGELWFRTSINGNLSNHCVYLIRQPLLFYREDTTQNYQKHSRRIDYINKHLNKHLPAFPLGQRIYGRILWTLRNNFYLFGTVLGILPFLKQLREKKIIGTALFDELNTDLQNVLKTPVPGMDEWLAKHSV